MRTLIFLPCLLLLVFTAGCQEEASQPAEVALQSTQDQAKAPKEHSLAADLKMATPSGPDKTEPAEKPEQPAALPSPPVSEDFQGDPQLTLFPRVGDFRPADDSDHLPYWNTFIDHLIKVTGVAEDQATGNRGWVFRGINSIDSVGFFSPLGVEPQTTYQVSFTLAAELVEGASAGIGILEFNEFLWIPGQYTEETFKQHFRGSHEGVRLTGTTKGEHGFTFTTGPETRMIHLILFREGAHDRNSVMFDDIKIVKREA